MKKLIIPLIALITLTYNGYSQAKTGTASQVIHITNDQFKKLVFDYEKSKEWNYLGSKPCIIDFYADWCGPCRMMSPKLEEIAQKYSGKIIVYKVDTDKEQILSSNMGIQSLPTIVFIPQNGKPQASLGVIPKESLEKAIHEVLLIK